MAVVPAAAAGGLSNSSDELIVGCREIAEDAGCLLQTHACFNYSTHDDCLANFGTAEIERLENLGVLDEHTLLVHSGWLEPRATLLIATRRFDEALESLGALLADPVAHPAMMMGPRTLGPHTSCL